MLNPSSRSHAGVTNEIIPSKSAKFGSRPALAAAISSISKMGGDTVTLCLFHLGSTGFARNKDGKAHIAKHLTSTYAQLTKDNIDIRKAL